MSHKPSFSTLRSILVPTDLSSLSRVAIEYAKEMAEERSARLHLLHVVQPPPYDPMIFPGVSVPTADTGNVVREAFERFAEDWPDAVLHQREGRPHEEILEMASEIPSQLIVMSTHGRTGLSHALIGSVAEKVIRRSECPVLVVRPHS